MNTAVSENEKKNRSIALVISLAFHALLILLLLLWVFRTPIPPYPEGAGGMEVNLGYDDQGMGTVLTTNQSGSENPASKTVKENIKETNKTKTSDAKIATNDVEKTDKIKTSDKVSDNPSKEMQPDNELMNALNKLKNKNKRSGNDGITGQPGNQGDPNGTNNTTNYSGKPGTGDKSGPGGPPGTGTVNLAGRKVVARPTLSDDIQESGIVAVEITVDSTGRVIRANATLKGSTTTSSVLFSKARQYALKYKFDKAEEAPDQRGVIYFNFKVGK